MHNLLQDLLTPAPPAPPNAAPALAPEQALPPKAGSRQPESGRNDSNGTSCEGQGMQGRCKCVPRRSDMHMPLPSSFVEDLSCRFGTGQLKAGCRRGSKALCHKQCT